MSKFYEELKVVGQIITEFDCDGFPEKPISGVTLEVLSPTLQPLAKSQTESDDNGMF